MDVLDLNEEIKNLKYNGITLNLDERYYKSTLSKLLSEFSWKQQS